MKLLATALFVLLTAINPASLAQTADSSQAQFSFNQSALSLNLEQKEFETIYRTDQVPDTCYRDEVQGTRNECHTEYDRQCNTRYEQVCEYRNYPVCQTVPRNVCRTEQRCTTRNDQVCTPRGCTNVPRNTCTPVQHCSTQMDRVCHNEQRYECQTLPRQYCQDVPRQACRDVPNVVRVPYACTRPVQVPNGQQLKFTTVARVNLGLANFAEVGQLSDVLIAKLDTKGQVSVASVNPTQSAYLYQIVNQQRQEQMISANEKQVTYTLLVKAISIQNLNAALNSSVNSSKINLDRIELVLSNLSQLSNAPVKGHLKVLQQKNNRTSYIIVNRDFTAKDFLSQGANVTLMMKSFGVNSLVSGKLHTVEFSLKADITELKKNLLNAEALVLVSDKTLSATFEGTPTN